MASQMIWPKLWLVWDKTGAWCKIDSIYYPSLIRNIEEHASIFPEMVQNTQLEIWDDIWYPSLEFRTVHGTPARNLGWYMIHQHWRDVTQCTSIWWDVLEYAGKVPCFWHSPMRRSLISASSYRSPSQYTSLHPGKYHPRCYLLANSLALILTFVISEPYRQASRTLSWHNATFQILSPILPPIRHGFTSNRISNYSGPRSFKKRPKA